MQRSKGTSAEKMRAREGMRLDWCPFLDLYVLLMCC